MTDTSFFRGRATLDAAPHIARSASRCRPTRRSPPTPARSSRSPRRRCQAPSQAASLPHHLVPGRGHRGVPDRRLLPGRRAGRELRQCLQAGLDPVGGDGRLLHRCQRRPAVRGAAGGAGVQVHQHDLRAQRDDRRPGHPHRPEPGRLPGPPAGHRLPGRRDPSRARDQDDRRAHRRGQRHRRARPGRARRPGARSGPGRLPADAGGRGAPAAAPKPAPTPVSQAPAFTPGMAAVDAPYCSTCGVRMRPAGSCFVCESCGTTSGCS